MVASCSVLGASDGCPGMPNFLCQFVVPRLPAGRMRGKSWRTSVVPLPRLCSTITQHPEPWKTCSCAHTQKQDKTGQISRENGTQLQIRQKEKTDRSLYLRVYRGDFDKKQDAEPTGLEIVGHDTEGFKLWPVPKTVPSCSRVLGFEHVLIVLDYSVERCKSGRQIK
jgi:hypothetical protein